MVEAVALWSIMRVMPTFASTQKGLLDVVSAVQTCCVGASAMLFHSVVAFCPLLFFFFVPSTSYS